MKKILLFILILTFSITFFSCKKEEHGQLKAEQNGIVAGDIESAKNNAKILNSLIKKSKKYQNCEIIFENKTYYFDTSSGIKIDGVNNLSFIGNNTTFINTSYDNSDFKNFLDSSFFIFSKSDNIKIENINFDYLDYTSINGKVVFSAFGTTLIEISEDLAKYIDGNEKVCAINEVKNSQIIQDVYLDTPSSVTFYKEKRTIQIDKLPTQFDEGNTLILRFGLGQQLSPFYISSTDNLTLKNVTVYSSPSATVFCTDSSSNFTFDNFNITPKSGMLYSSNVDGIHLKNFTGEVVLKNCSFKGMGDDSLNVNSRAAVVTKINGSKLTIKSGYEQESLPPKWACEDDILNVYTADWEKIATLKVVKTSLNTITVSGDTSKIKEGVFVENTRFLPKITIENTNVEFTRARAFLIRSKDVTVENCTVKNTRLSAIIVAADIKKWYEMSPTQNLTISNCIFENCNTSKHDSVISIKYADDTNETYENTIHENIIINNNVFKNLDSVAIHARGVDGITIKDNEIKDFDKNVFIENCINVVVEN